MCAGLWWEDIAGGTAYDRPHEALADAKHGHPGRLVPPAVGADDHRLVQRVRPSFRYAGRRAPLDVKGEYQPAMFASFPLSRVVVVRDPEGGTHEDALRATDRIKGLPVSVVEQ
jgi:hypothetical protein